MIRDRIKELRRVRAGELLVGNVAPGLAGGYATHETPSQVEVESEPLIAQSTCVGLPDGANGYAMEIHPPYVAVALERMARMGLAPQMLS